MIRILFVLVLVIVIIGCYNQPSQLSNNGASSDTDSSQTATQNGVYPIKVVVYQDMSGSGLHNITPQLGVSDMEPLISYIAENGLELGVGIIDAQSNKPLLRLFLEPPVKDFSEPDKDENTFILVKARQQHKLSLERYNREMESYRSQTESEVEKFRQKAQILLAKQPDASYSNIFSAIARGNLFLSEQCSYQFPVKKYLVLVSDGQHNVNGIPKASLKSHAKVILVNGSGAIGSLGYISPKCFENIQSAVRYILADATKGSDDNAK